MPLTAHDEQPVVSKHYQKWARISMWMDASCDGRSIDDMHGILSKQVSGDSLRPQILMWMAASCDDRFIDDMHGILSNHHSVGRHKYLWIPCVHMQDTMVHHHFNYQGMEILFLVFNIDWSASHAVKCCRF